jgi:hypothetical protein
MLATGLKVFGFKPGLGNGFLRVMKIQSMPSFREEVKPSLASMSKNTSQGQTQHSLRFFLLLVTR